jgi:DNA topoisomerase IA
MDWLIITENLEKATAIRKALPDATVISSKGLPWAPEIELYGASISYKKVPRESHRDRLEQAEAASLDCDRILLAFEPTTAGEACASEFENLLGRERCARWTGQSLDPRDIRAAIGDLENMAMKDMPKSVRGLGESYWVQSAMDITWTARITGWIEEKTSRTEKITRLMAGLLKTIVDEKRKQELFVTREYWELKCRAKRPEETGPGQTAYAVVPAFTQLRAESAPRTREVWKRKIQEAKVAAGAGRGLPQPEPGLPWRFESREEATSQRTYMEKFPYFVVEAKTETIQRRAGTPPATADTILDAALEAGKGRPEEIEGALMDLYHAGWITHPRSTNPNLSKKTIERLISFGNKAGIAMDREPRVYGDPLHHERWTEAIRPTNWERTPEKALSLIPEGVSRERRLWLYKHIYQKAMESQMPNKEENIQRCFLLGPLFVRRKTAQENRGKSFQTRKETKLGAHMNIILSMNWAGEEAPEEDSVVECRQIETSPQLIEPPGKLTESLLYTRMGDEGLGKKETLRKRLNELKKQGSVEIRGGEIFLTEKGASLAQLLNNHFGQFLDKNYHRTVAEALRAIEANEADPHEFLKEWWDCFRTYLEEES